MARPTTTNLEDPAAVAALVRTVEQKDASQKQRMDNLDLFQNGRNPIIMPEGTSNPAIVRSHMVRSQHQLVEGLLRGVATLRVSTGAQSDVEAQRKRAQDRENIGNRVFDVLEQRSSTRVRSLARKDQVRYGFGAIRLEGDPSKLGKDAPDRSNWSDDRTGSDQYQGALSQHRRGLAAKLELPYRFDHVRARDFSYRRSRESPNGLGTTVEWQTRTLAECLESPYYSLTKLKTAANSFASAPDDVLEATLVHLVRVENRERTTTLFRPIQPRRADYPGSWDIQRSLWQEWREGEIGESKPNLVGYPQYVLLPGLQSGSGDPSQQFEGFCYGILPLADALDHYLSARMTRMKKYLLNPWVGEQALLNPNGSPQGQGAAEDADEEDSGFIKFYPGRDGLSMLPPGVSLKPVVNPGGGPEEQALYEEVKRLMELQVIPSTLMDARGIDVGYLFESLANTVMSRATDLIEGTIPFTVQCYRLLVRITEILGQPVEMMGVADHKEHSAPWLVLDPEKDTDPYEILDAIYDPLRNKPQNRAQNAQVASQLQATGLMRDEDIAADVLGVEDFEAVQFDRDLKAFKAQPDIQSASMARVAEQAGLLQDKNRAAKAGKLTLNTLLAGNATLAARIRAAMIPGAPHASVVEQVPPGIGAGLPQNQQQEPQAPGTAPLPRPSPNGVPSPIAPAHRLAQPKRRGGQGGRRAGQAGGLPAVRPVGGL